MDWLTSFGLAELGGISERKARAALARILSGKSETWRGAGLVVRKIKGRGGRAGVQYQVRDDSLPSDLQERLKALKRRFPLRLGAATLDKVGNPFQHSRRATPMRIVVGDVHPSDIILHSQSPKAPELALQRL